MPSAAARIAIAVAAQDAMPARNSQPGDTRSPLPPSSAGMSDSMRVPFAWPATMRVPPDQRAVAGASSRTPMPGSSSSMLRPRRKAAARSFMPMAKGLRFG
ncbi:MAG: hypothetical protein ABI585_09910 [Betaproteobacteria bacterium]